MPTQLVDRVCAHFRKSLSSKKSPAFSLEGLISDKYKPLCET